MLRIAVFALIASGAFLGLGIQRLMKQMRIDVDAKNEVKLAKYQTPWSLWPRHRAEFPSSLLRKSHEFLLVGAILAMAAYVLVYYAEILLSP
jgi:hypothetical protein